MHRPPDCAVTLSVCELTWTGKGTDIALVVAIATTTRMLLTYYPVQPGCLPETLMVINCRPVTALMCSVVNTRDADRLSAFVDDNHQVERVHLIMRPRQVLDTDRLIRLMWWSTSIKETNIKIEFLHETQNSSISCMVQGMYRIPSVADFRMLFGYTYTKYLCEFLGFLHMSYTVKYIEVSTLGHVCNQVVSDLIRECRGQVSLKRLCIMAPPSICNEDCNERIKGVLEQLYGRRAVSTPDECESVSLRICM